MKMKKKIVFIILIIISIVNGITGPLSVLIQEYLINTIEHVTSKILPTKMLIFPIVLLFLLYIIPNLRFITEYLKIKWDAELEISNILDLENKVSKISYIFWEDNEIFNTITYLKENNRYEIRYSLILQLLQFIIASAMYIYVLLRYSWFLPILCLIFLPFITYYAMKYAKEYYNKLFSLTFDQRLAKDKMNILTEGEYAKELRMFGAKEYVLQDYAERIKLFNHEYLKNLMKYSVVSKLISITKYIPIFLCLVSVLFLYSGKYITLAAFIALSGHLIHMNFLEFSQGLVSNYSRYKVVCKKYKELNHLLSTETDVTYKKFNQNHPIEITFEHVFFRYPNSDDYMLKDISFQVKGDKTIALVGENGSGKSTLIKLMLGLYRPEKGRILINKTDINTLSTKIYLKFLDVHFKIM